LKEQNANKTYKLKNLSFAGRKAKKCTQGRKEAGGLIQEDNKTGNAHITMRHIHATIVAMEKQ
jgi:hypothetical protein